MPSKFPWLDAIISLIGTKEIPGDKNNAKIMAMFPASNHPEVKSELTAWCAACIGYVLKISGYKNTGSLMARSYLHYGVACLAQPGAIGILPRGHDGVSGHVVIVERVEGDIIHTVGGNESDMVKRNTYHRNEFLGFRMPREADKIKAATKSKIVLSGSTVATSGAADVAVQTHDAAVQASTAVEQAKEIAKQAVDAATDAASKAADTASTIDPADVLAKAKAAKDVADSFGMWDVFVHTIQTLVSSPRFWIGLGMAGLGAGIAYWRWKDHGQGQAS